MKTLTETVKEIMDKCESPVQLPEQKGFPTGKEWAIYRLLEVIKERDAYVIGEYEEDWTKQIKNNDKPIWSIETKRNELKREQHKRAEESL